MKLRPRLLVDKLRTSLWLVPMGLVLSMAAAAHLLLRLDQRLQLDLPLMAGAGIAGARGMFQAVAGSMITLAGLVFSMTLVVLSQAASQYTSRVMRNFLGDRVNQVVLGVFLGIYAYCLMVLRGLGDDGAPVPVLSVLAGMAFALAGVVFLIYFIHHVARSLRVENLVATIQDDTLPVIDRLYPEAAGTGPAAAAGAGGRWATPGVPAVPATTSGYIQDIDADCLAEVACALDAAIEVPFVPGAFVVEGEALVRIHGAARPDPEQQGRIRQAFTCGRSRSIQQDPAFGLRQLVDIAMRALSPGVNDTTTAVLVLDRLAVLIRRLGQRGMPSPHREVDGVVRLVLARPGFEDYLGLAFDQIRQWAADNPALLGRLLDVLAGLLGVVTDPERRALLHEHGRRVMAAAERAIKETCDLDFLRTRHARLAAAGAPLSPSGARPGQA